MFRMRTNRYGTKSVCNNRTAGICIVFAVEKDRQVARTRRIIKRGCLSDSLYLKKIQTYFDGGVYVKTE